MNGDFTNDNEKLKQLHDVSISEVSNNSIHHALAMKYISNSEEAVISLLLGHCSTEEEIVSNPDLYYKYLNSINIYDSEIADKIRFITHNGEQLIMTEQGNMLFETLSDNYFNQDVIISIYDEAKKLLGNNTFKKTLS